MEAKGDLMRARDQGAAGIWGCRDPLPPGSYTEGSMPYCGRTAELGRQEAEPCLGPMVPLRLGSWGAALLLGRGEEEIPVGGVTWGSTCWINRAGSPAGEAVQAWGSTRGQE
ncbi:hypothetical protein NDU88_002669 [Pleurodeles waltl]|uniref:Uncharacterized protein n=1 Tax=Pleurodeles waltl TaxID=8319 RepID=A0AAV7M192_PLEWA|nr:hypothetical protein NDU88_002669 [Pleurodeles waltl]